jgi:hypothetical protein
MRVFPKFFIFFRRDLDEKKVMLRKQKDQNGMVKADAMAMHWNQMAVSRHVMACHVKVEQTRQSDSTVAAQHMQVDHDTSPTALNVPFTTEEVHTLLRVVPTARHHTVVPCDTQGGDSVPMELEKHAGQALTHLLCRLLDHAWVTELIPSSSGLQPHAL